MRRDPDVFSSDASGSAGTSRCSHGVVMRQDDRTVGKCESNGGETTRRQALPQHAVGYRGVRVACESRRQVGKENSAACKSLLQSDLPQSKPDFTDNGDIMQNCGEPSHASALYKKMLASYVPPTPAPTSKPCNAYTKAAQARLCEKTSGKHH